jgi:L-threonylcarbamoyladenylate synthase
VGEILTSVDEAAAIVDRGGVIVVPTETVYGLAGKPVAEVVERILRIKERPVEKSIQLLLAGAEWMERVAQTSTAADALARAFWPGPLTLVLHAADDAPPALVSDETIGVRVPAHPTVLELLGRCGPLAASSANPSGLPTAPTVGDIRRIFGDRVDGYLDGGRIAGTGSTVVDLTTDPANVLRVGPIGLNDLRSVTGGRFERA